MPEISRFFGIVIFLNFEDHAPPHFHARYGGDELLVRIKDLSVMRGKMSARATGLIMEWASLHQAELLAGWEDAQAHRIPTKIAPLQ
jgi:hypothetical protein